MTMTLAIIIGVAGSLIASIIWSTVGDGYGRWFGKGIKITNPADNGFLAPMEIRRGVQAHPVSGTLKYVPKGHKIWLVVANEAHGKFWPQGFEPVEYNRATGTWSGYITVFGWHRVAIYAVVAPPTTQEYFDYFQRVGGVTKHEPLLKIPAECKRRDVVSAKPRPS
jgi:hypothetical protein